MTMVVDEMNLLVTKLDAKFDPIGFIFVLQVLGNREDAGVGGAGDVNGVCGSEDLTRW
jgi:hypothetical protein